MSGQFDFDLWGNALPGGGDDREIGLRRYKMHKVETESAVKMIYKNLMSHEVLADNPLMALVITNAVPMVEVFGKELELALTPFLFAAERGDEPVNFIVAPFMEAGDEAGNAGVFVDGLRDMVGEMYKTCAILTPVREAFSDIEPVVIEGDVVDAWLLMEAEAFWGPALYTAGVLSGLLTMPFYTFEDVVPEGSDLRTGVARFIDLYFRVTEEFAGLVDTAVGLLESRS